MIKKKEFILAKKVFFTERVTKQVKAFALFTKPYIYIFPYSSIENFFLAKIKKTYAFDQKYINKITALYKMLPETEFHDKIKNILPEKHIIDTRYLIEFNIFSHWYSSGIGYRKQTGTHKVFGIKPRSLAKEIQSFYNKLPV